MNRIDEKYLNGITDIMTYGYEYDDPNREGVKRKEIETLIINHLAQDGYPIISARKTFFKGAVGELLLFLKGENDIRKYRKYGIKFWDSDTERYEGNLSKYPISEYKEWFEKDKKLSKVQTEDIPFEPDNQFIPENTEVVHTTNDGEEFIILEIFPKYGGKYKACLIKFLNGGAEKEVMFTKKNLNSAKNPYQITFLDKGCTGEFDKLNLSPNEHKYIKSVWNGMMSRCYDSKNKQFSNYGGKGVVVSKRWKCYEYFATDFRKYENFNNSLSEPKSYQLDKDFLGDGYEYSFEKCDLILTSSNISGVKKVVFELENIETNEIVYTDNIWNFIKDRKLGKSAESSFYNLLNGKLKTCKKWKCNSFSPKKNDMGKIYPHQYKKQYHVFDNFKENRMRTDLVVDAWQVDDLKHMALIPCHFGFQLLGSPEGFKICWFQRSTDFMLGSPINIQYYFLMGMLLEEWSGHTFLGITGILNNCHLYDNQFDLAEKMIPMIDEKVTEPYVTLKIPEEVKDLPFGEFIKHIEPSHFTLRNYTYLIDETVEMLTYTK